MAGLGIAGIALLATAAAVTEMTPAETYILS